MKWTDDQVAEARRQLRLLLTRRDFLGAASAGVLGLAGCNSDPTTPGGPATPGTIPSGFQSVGGTVSLPAGSQLKVTDLSVDVLTQTVPVSASSAFTVGISSDGPALALLLDKNGDGVLMSMLDAGLATHAISSHTTAVALLYYATGAFLLPAPAMSQVLALLDGDPAIAGLESAVANAVAADPHALASNAPALGPAVTQVLQTIVGSSLRGPAAALRPVAIHSSADVPTLMLLNSAAEQNGAVVSLDTAAISVLISNARRRPCKVYVYEVATLTGDTTLDVAPATLVQGPFEIDSTQNLGLLNGLKAIAHGLNGQAPWTPVNLPPIPLTLAPATADKTTFQAIVLSSSAKWVSGDTYEPAFFRDPHFVNEIAKWRADTQALWAMTVLGDLVLPSLCFLGGFGAIVAARATVAAEVTNTATLGSATFRNIIATLQDGSLGPLEKGLAAVVQNAVNSEIAGNLPDFWLPKVKAVVSDARAAALAVQSAPTIGSRLAKGAKMFGAVLEPLFVVGFVLDGIDFGKVVYDFAASDIGASWEVDLYRQKLGLIPQDPRIAGGERVSFRVSQPANLPAGSYQYDWTQTSPFATLSAVGEANVGPSITTSQLSVDLITTGSDVLPINLVVVGYDISKSPRQEIGRAGTTVSFLAPAQILPTGAAMSPGDQRTFSAVVGGTPPPQVSSYRWTLTGTAGSIGSSNVVTTSVPNVNYTAGVPGTDSLHVDVLFGTTVVAKADVSIAVVAAASIQFVIAGTWAQADFPPNGSYAYTSFIGARSVQVQPGLDLIQLDYDIASGGESGVDLSIVLPTGEAVRRGEVFPKVPNGQLPSAEHFQFALAKDLSAPDGIVRLPPQGTGSFTINSLSQLLDGTLVAQYAFSINNGSGGTIVGSGVGRWK